MGARPDRTDRVALGAHALGQCKPVALQLAQGISVGKRGGGTEQRAGNCDDCGQDVQTLILLPLPPMCGTDVYLFFRVSTNPAASRATTGECQGMGAVSVDNSKLKIKLKRSGINGLPVHYENLWCRLMISLICSKRCFECHQRFAGRNAPKANQSPDARDHHSRRTAHGCASRAFNVVAFGQ